MVRLTVASVALMICFCPAPAAEPERVAAEWNRFFDGVWEREQRLWSEDDGWSSETVDWSCESVAGDLTSISKGTSTWGKFVVVNGIEPSTDRLFEYGSAENGTRWRIDWRSVTDDALEGKLLAVIDGKSEGEGSVKIVRMGDDKYTSKWTLTTEDGVTLKGEATNTRTEDEK
jgi:hypothetical protein